MPTIGGTEYDPSRLAGLAMSYGRPDLAWFAGRSCLGFGTDEASVCEWHAAIAVLGDGVLSVGPSGEGHLVLVSPALAKEAIYEPARRILKVSYGSIPVQISGITAEQYRDFVAGMPSDSWHTPIQRRG